MNFPKACWPRPRQNSRQGLMEVSLRGSANLFICDHLATCVTQEVSWHLAMPAALPPACHCRIWTMPSLSGEPCRRGLAFSRARSWRIDDDLIFPARRAFTAVADCASRGNGKPKDIHDLAEFGDRRVAYIFRKIKVLKCLGDCVKCAAQNSSIIEIVGDARPHLANSDQCDARRFLSFCP